MEHEPCKELTRQCPFEHLNHSKMLFKTHTHTNTHMHTHACMVQSLWGILTGVAHQNS